MNFLKKSFFSKGLYKQNYLSNLEFTNRFNFIVKKNFYFHQAKHGAGEVSYFLNKILFKKFYKLIFLLPLASYCSKKSYQMCW